MPTNSVARLVACEVRWLVEKPWHEVGDVNEAAKRVIALSPHWPLTMDFVVEMITNGVIDALENERAELITEGIKQNKLDQLQKMFA